MRADTVREVLIAAMFTAKLDASFRALECADLVVETLLRGLGGPNVRQTDRPGGRAVDGANRPRLNHQSIWGDR